MPVGIRSVRRMDRDEAPTFWQGCRLRGGALAAGWTAGLLLSGAGVSAMVAGSGGPLALPGALAAALGAVCLAGVVRCRRLEVVVGRNWLQVQVGPFRRTVALGLLGPPRTGRATAWRRWFARREVCVEVVPSGEVLRLPSQEPEELVRAMTVAIGAGRGDVTSGRRKPPEVRR